MTEPAGQNGKPVAANSKKNVVCYFFANGTGRNGASCPFLHEIVEEKMPECSTFAQTGICNITNCKFKHTVIEKTVECKNYNEGFCKWGPTCKYKHVKRELGIDFANGFCPKGPSGDKYHSPVSMKVLVETYYQVNFRSGIPFE